VQAAYVALHNLREPETVAANRGKDVGDLLPWKRRTANAFV
jgi:N-acetyl-anhydromuramyl-L-alanine amidase AmpD